MRFDGPFAARGNPNSMLTSTSDSIGYDFEPDDRFSLDTYASDASDVNWPKLHPYDEWDAPFNPSPSPLLSELSTFSSLSSITTSLSSSPRLSLFLPSPAPTELSLDDSSAQRLDEPEPENTARITDRACHTQHANQNLDSSPKREICDNQNFILGCNPSAIKGKKADDTKNGQVQVAYPMRVHTLGQHVADSGINCCTEAGSTEIPSKRRRGQNDKAVKSGSAIRSRKGHSDKRKEPYMLRPVEIKADIKAEWSEDRDTKRYASFCDGKPSKYDTGHSLLKPRSKKGRVTYHDLLCLDHPATHVSHKFTISPSDCQTCIFGSPRTHDMVRHLMSYHLPSAIVCQNCETEFSRADALARHVDRGACSGKKRKTRMRQWEVEAAERVIHNT